MAIRAARALAWLRRREEGQAGIEFLLVVPTFIVFLLLIVDFGMLTYQYVSVANAAREGARFAATNCLDGFCSVAKVRTRTIDRSGGILSSSNPGEVTVGWMDVNGDGLNGGRGDSVVVHVNHTYNSPFLLAAIRIPVVSCADMRLERTDRTVGLPTGTECPHS